MKRGVDDPLLGYVSIPLQGSFYGNVDRTEILLRGVCEDGRQAQGCLVLSFTTGPPQFTTKNIIEFFGPHPHTPLYEAIPNVDAHRQSYGIQVPNFRDIGGWNVTFSDKKSVRKGVMKSRVLFRTSGIHRATESDANLIVNELNIRHMIDLRTYGLTSSSSSSFIDCVECEREGCNLIVVSNI
jgi:hypothetical protein